MVDRFLRAKKLMAAGLLILGLGSFLGPSETRSSQETDGKEVVFLLHGLGRTSRSMADLGRGLRQAGFQVVNFKYASTREEISAHAERLGRELERHRGARSIHFVTHSLGGIVVRFYLAEHELASLGRVVMISPPNAGSELVDALRENPLFRAGLGPSALQLGTDAESVPNRLPPIDFDLGVITGNRTLNPLFSRLIPGEDDGKVSVESARAAGMSDFLVVPHSHPFIMNSPEVVRQTARFLRHGAFEHPPAETASGSPDPGDPPAGSSD